MPALSTSVRPYQPPIRPHRLTLTVLLAAVALVTSALVSAIGCTAMIFMAVDDPPRRITPTCPFLGR
jgi:hypothetical protein